MDDCQMCFVQHVTKRYWAIVELGDQLPHPPILVTRFKWYARWCCWWMADGPDLVVIPWDV